VVDNADGTATTFGTVAASDTITLNRTTTGSVKIGERFFLKDVKAGYWSVRGVVIATGSEVALALAARERLAQDKITAGVVSLPSHDLFEQQDAAYRQQVLPDTVKARVAIEAGVSFGWDRWTGSAGEKVTLDRYGASAPGEIVQEKLGFTVEAVVAAAKKSIARSRS
jgi:transketolase